MWSDQQKGVGDGSPGWYIERRRPGYGAAAWSPVSPPSTIGVSFPSVSRYNDFLHDPLSLCKACTPKPNGENAISARSDLNPANGSYPFQALRQRSHGGIDVKVPGSGCCGWGAVRVGGEPQGFLGWEDVDTRPPLTHR